MVKGIALSIVSVCVLVLFAGCRKSDDFLYYLNDHAVQLKSSHKIKDLVGNNNADLLWVIDNSGSMSPYQQSIKNNTQLFINTLVQSSILKWKIGILSTDTADKPYIGFAPGDDLNSQTVDPTNKFITAVSRLGTFGSGQEKTYEPIMNSLKAYPNFPRPKATLVIILVSDAPEQSNLTTAQFLNFLGTVKSDVHSILFYGILCPHDWCQPTDDEWWWKGSKFLELMNGVKSKAYPICDADFGKNLTSIGKDIVLQATSPKIFLDSRPRPTTIKVLYKGQEIAGGPGGYWSYQPDINAIVFSKLDFAPGETEEVEVNFTVDNGNPF